VKVFDGATLLGSVLANGAGAWSYTTAALANGAHSLTATATDATGTTSVASAALSVTVDTTAPIAPSITAFSPDSGVVGDHITSDNTLTLTGTAEANSTVKVYENSALVGTTTADGTGAWAYTSGPLPDGPHAFTATDTDIADNTSAASQPLEAITGAPSVLASNGSAVLAEIGNHFYLYPLKFNGADVTAEAWTPFAAEPTKSGYDIALKFGGSTGSSGHHMANAFIKVSGAHSNLMSLERSFHQDLDGDGVIGAPTHKDSTSTTETKVIDTKIGHHNHQGLNGDGIVAVPSEVASPLGLHGGSNHAPATQAKTYLNNNISHVSTNKPSLISDTFKFADLPPNNIHGMAGSADFHALSALSTNVNHDGSFEFNMNDPNSPSLPATNQFVFNASADHGSTEINFLLHPHDFHHV
jgi:hypothetical protein